MPPRRATGTMSENLQERHCRRSADVGIEFVSLSHGDEVYIGDTVIVETGGCLDEVVPHRLAGV